MNFFEHQARARGQTRWLVVLFLIAVAGIVAAICGVALVLLAFGEEQPAAPAMREHADALLLIALATLAVIGCASLYKSASLRSGGGSVARALGGTLVSADTRDARLRRLRNVVEEIAIASGTPVPEIYVLEQEAGINAFAAGWSPADAAVAVTRGTLEKLSRDELQGVIAHEFSHVLNGDMRLNIRLMGVLFGIFVIAFIGRKVMRVSADSGEKEGLIGLLIGFALMCAGYIGYFFGQMIKAGVSRQREFLADSSAVQFTRQTAGIAGALKKIGGVASGSRLRAAEADNVSHMLFGDGLGYSALFATHPPLFERIRRIDPQFKPEQLAKRKPEWNAPGYRGDDAEADRPVTAGIGGSVLPGTGNVAAHVARPGEADYRHAEIVHASIAPGLAAAAGSEAQAMSLLFALLLGEPADLRRRQLQMVARRFGDAQSLAAQQLPLSDLPAAQRLPLAALALPSLRRRPREELEKFLLTAHEMIRADGEVCLFEFCLGTLLRVQVTDLLYPSRAQVLGRQRLGQCRDAAVTLLAVLAQQGQADMPAARQAFAAGIGALFGSAALRYEPPAQPAAALQQALGLLDKLDAPGKQLLIEAMVSTLRHDRKITVGEAELLRAVCGALHCPLPPLLGA